jgi:hypothetical protein
MNPFAMTRRFDRCAARLPVAIGQIVGLWLVLALASWPSAKTWAAAPAKRARPPKFSKSITDAFFPDAREKLVGARPQKAAAASASEGGPAADAARATPDGPGGGWKHLITAEVVEDEIKTQQLKLGETVKSSTKFKGGDYQRARMHFSVLAAMLAIDAQYGEKMRWQREAPAMRDMTARAGFNCKVGTDASYKEAKSRAEDLENLVRGTPLQLPGASSETAWSKVADRAPLMKRLEQAHQQGLVPWTANAREFSRNAERLSHEAQLVAALADVIAREGYEFSDDETYREYARAMQTQALLARDAIDQNDYEQARRAVGEISKACANCHEGFRS